MFQRQKLPQNQSSLQVCQFNDGWIIAWEVICGAQILYRLDINGNVPAFVFLNTYCIHTLLLNLLYGITLY